MSTRLPDWNGRLVRWAREQRGRAFVWGETDCASLVRTAYGVMCGSHAILDGPSWTTRTGALRVHRRVGGAAAWLERDAGFGRVSWHFATSGDVLIKPANGKPVFDQLHLIVVDRLLVALEGEPVRLLPRTPFRPRTAVALRG